MAAYGNALDISIHALLAESDHNLEELGYLQIISIHALLAESDVDGRLQSRTYQAFLSTLSLRRATIALITSNATARISIHALLAESDVDAVVEETGVADFYPRSPCGERPG